MKKLIATLLPWLTAAGLVIFGVISDETTTEYVVVESMPVEDVELRESSPVAIYESMKPEIKAMLIEKQENEEEVVEEPIVKQEKPQYSLTDEEIDLIALLTMAEAEGECEEGQRLVIDTVLNRVDSELRYFPDTVHDVIYQKNAFTSMHNGRVERCYVKEEIRQLVIEELQERTNYNVGYFRTKYYSKYGTPMFDGPVGNHYFSSI